MTNEVKEAKRKYRRLNDLPDEKLCAWAQVEQSVLAEWRRMDLVVTMICSLAEAIGESDEYFTFTSAHGNVLVVDKVGEVGKPAIPSGEILARIEAFLKLGYTLRRCASLANIPHRTLYDRYEKDEDFRTKVDAYKEFPNLLARTVIIGNIQAGNADVSMAWLENTDPEFGKRQKMVMEDDVATNTSELTPEETERINRVGNALDLTLKENEHIGLVTPQQDGTA